MNRPIRILQVLGEMNRGGAETMIMNVYRNIDHSKIQFDFIVHTNEKCAFDDEILSLGGNIYRVPSYTGLNHLTYIKAWEYFFDNNKQYKMIHSHIRSTASIFLKIAKEYGLITIVHSHNTSNRTGFSSCLKKIIQIPIKKASYIDYRLACGREAGKWLFGNSDFQVINNSIECENFIFNKDKRYSTREIYNLQGKFIIGHIGSFRKVKNHTFLIDIFSAIHKQNKNAVLMLVGDGKLREQMQKKVDNLGLSNNVIFTGIKTNVNELLMSMDVFLFPSIFEGLPVTIVEAQATGIKCIISDTITDEVCFTDLVESISLDKSVEYWAKKVLDSNNGYQRKNYQKAIFDNGYDINSTVTYLEKLYLI